MNAMKQILGCIRKADQDYGMIADHDRIAVGVSGGKDSMLLLYCLHLYQQFCQRIQSKQFEVVGIHIQMGFPSMDFTDAAGQVALSAEIVDWIADAQKGERLARLITPLPSLDEALHAVGHTPLPPYIKDYAGDEELYQTVYSRRESSAAAPTAGLHFTPELIERLHKQGVGWETVELEVGLDTI